MRNWVLVLCATAAAIPAQVSAEDHNTKNVARVVASDPKSLAQLIDVSDDKLDTFISMSSEPIYQETRGLLKIATEDRFLRAFVDKKTGTAIIQVYVWTAYSGDWAFFNSATYMSPDGPKQADFHVLDRKVQGCGRYDCSEVETFAFDVDESDLRWAAADAKAGNGAIWEFRLRSKSGQAVTTQLLKNEVAAFLFRLDEVRASLRK